MANYILNIKTHKIHDGKNPCAHCKAMGEPNKNYFDKLEDAVNYFEGSKKGEKCYVCFKDDV